MTTNLNPQQQAAFYAHMAAYQKDEVVGVLAALFLGTFGVHHFYLRRNGLGILYLFFCWTGIPTVLGWIECFFMPGRVRRYNAEQAVLVASMIAAGGYPAVAPAWSGVPAIEPAIQSASQPICHRCGAGTPAGARFCSYCGQPV